MDKDRLDIFLVNQKHFESREKAQANILAGNIHVNGALADKPSRLVSISDTIEVKKTGDLFSSRGGNKLEKALMEFMLDVQDLCGTDIGASTGGFTDCLLKHGARKIYAVDVGYGQLDYRLRMDARVKVMERTNARYLKPDMFDEMPDFATIDVSFISVQKILPALSVCLKDNSFIISLVKPQFEAGRSQIGKNGVVRDEAIHKKTLADVCSYFTDNGYEIQGMTFSPIKGPKGNIEFLIYAGKGTYNKSKITDISHAAHEIVEKAHMNF
jgi:23S rRNA (cytidine1920-2'-O)/16S rRNA (cytidine1409-2'-O)-methyltransferase